MLAWKRAGVCVVASAWHVRLLSSNRERGRGCGSESPLWLDVTRTGPNTSIRSMNRGKSQKPDTENPVEGDLAGRCGRTRGEVVISWSSRSLVPWARGRTEEAHCHGVAEVLSSPPVGRGTGRRLGRYITRSGLMNSSRSIRSEAAAQAVVEEFAQRLRM